MPTPNHNLLLNRSFQYLGIILIVAAMGGGYWYWKQAQAGVTQQAANNQGLVGYWSFDEGTGTQAGDASGQGNTGTLTNGPTWVDGKLGKALDFDGTNDYADAGSGSSLRISGALSMSFWMYGRGSSTDAYIAGTAGTNLEGYSCTHHNGATVYCYLQNGGNSVSAAVGTNVWTHITFTWDGTTGTNGKKLYVNGVLQSQGTSSQSALSGWGNFRVGEDATATRTRFNGKVDELRIFNRALGATEITNLYNLGAAKLQKTQSSDLTNGLVGYWPFNGKDISGTTAYDRSGQGNNGTLTNGPTVTEGRSGQAIRFDGSNDYINVPDSASLRMGNGSMSFSFWMNPSNANQSSTIFAKRNAGAGFEQYGISIGSNNSHVPAAGKKINFIFMQQNAVTDRSGYTKNDIVDGNWHHIVVVADKVANTILVYDNGVSVPVTIDFNNGSWPTIDNTDPLTIGKSDSGNYYGAALDEPRIYNRALSVSEIWDLYQMGNPDHVNAADSQGDSLEKGMVGYWKLDDASGTSAADASGNANTGTLTNGPTWTTGKIDGATTFDGTDDYVTTGDINTVDGISSMSVSAWAKANALADDKTIFSKSNSSADTNRFGLSLAGTGYGGNNDITLNVSDGTNRYAYTNGDIVSAGVWNHYTMVFDGTQTGNANRLKLYQNGIQQTLTFGGGVTIPATTSASNAGVFQIGAETNHVTDNRYWNGALDEVRIYNRALSADEVTKLYKTTAPDDPDTGLVGYWSFNGPDLSGTTAYDRSGKGNTGTLTNGPTVTEGKAGQALNFDGSNDYVSAADANSLDMTDGQNFALSGWFKRNTATTTDTIVAKRASTNAVDTGYIVYLGATTDKLTFEASDGTDEYQLESTSAFTDTDWHFFSLVWDDGSSVNTKLYVDGVYETTTATGTFANVNSLANANLFRIGSDSNNGNPFDGKLDEPRVYNRVLSASEVFAQYAAGESNKKTCGTVTDADGNLYGTLVIGSQCWMKQNMRVGTRIAASGNQTDNGTIEKYCYSDSDANCTSANPNQPDGGLYQWDEAMQYSTTAGARGICPTSFHIPTDAEQHTLENYLKDSGQTCDGSRNGTWDCDTAGTKMKPNGISGFEGNLAGYANAGSFTLRGSNGYYWASTVSGANAWSQRMSSANSTVFRDLHGKSIGYSVRCIHD